MGIMYILIICYIAFKIIAYIDTESSIVLTVSYKRLLLIGSILSGIWMKQMQVNFWIYGVLFAYLLVSVCTDLQSMEVYDFMGYIATVTGILLLVVTPYWTKDNLVELIVFLMLQRFLFSHMIGGADCIAFGVCAIYITANGGGMLDFLLHMLSAVFLCGSYKFYRWMRTRKKKEPVAFVPYIAATVFLFL